MELDDDYLTQECKLMTENCALSVNDDAYLLKQRMAQLNQLRKSRHFCDVVLQIGAAEIHAHRSVLACASPYFYELFTTDDERKTAREDKVVYKLNGSFELESLEKLVQFAYTGDMEVPPSMVKHVYLAANKLKMDRVAHLCGGYLISQLTADNWLGIRTIPGIANDPDLVDQLDHYVQEQTDLMRITKDIVPGVCRIQLRVIQCSNEESFSVTSHALCFLTLEWIKRQMEDEQLALDALRDKKHLLYLNTDNSLHDCSDIRSGDVQDTEMVQDYKKISRKLSQTNLKTGRKIMAPLHPAKPRMMLYSRSISDEEEQQDAEWKLITHAEVAERSFVAIVTLNGTVSVLSIVTVVNPPSPTNRTPQQSRPTSVEKVNSYTLIPHMTSSKCAIGAGSFGGYLLVCGGYDRGECLKEVEVYSPKENVWHRLSDMKQARGRFDLTVLNGVAYAVGGCNGSKELSSVEALDKDTKIWRNVAPLPMARSNIGVCSANSKLYCIGGWNGYYGIKQCDVYDPQTNKWTNTQPLVTGRYQAGVAAIGDKVYAVGGCESWNCLSSVEVLDTELNQWRTLTPCASPRRGCGVAAFKGKLFVMGGSDGQQSLCSTEIYDPDTNTWTPGPPMTTCRANVGVAVVDDKLYAVGGFSGKNFLNTIEYLDPETMEWTNFTPKPDGYKSRRTSRVHLSSNSNDEESRSDSQDDFCNELDLSIPEESEPITICANRSAVVTNGFISSPCEMAN